MDRQPYNWSPACTCADRTAWEVWTRNGNYSAFNGYRFTPSAYSQVHCRRCGKVWRTKAKYVDDLPDAG